jgi:hypothetical protein
MYRGGPKQPAAARRHGGHREENVSIIRFTALLASAGAFAPSAAVAAGQATYEARIKSTDKDVFKVVDLIAGLTKLRQARDQFTSDAEQASKEEQLVQRLLGPKRELSFEFKSVGGDVSLLTTKTGVTWAPTTYDVRYDRTAKEMWTPPSFEDYNVMWFDKRPVQLREPYDKVPVIPVFSKFTDRGTYQAQNGFGVRAEVEVWRDDVMGLVVVDEAQRFLADKDFKSPPVAIEPDEARDAIKRLVWRVKVELASGKEGKYAIYRWDTAQRATLSDPTQREGYRAFIGVRVLDLKIVDPKTKRVFFSYEAPALLEGDQQAAN